jgi:hypothetical protein
VLFNRSLSGAGVLIYEAVRRIMSPEVVNGRLMFIIASCGLTISAPPPLRSLTALFDLLHPMTSRVRGGE